MKFLYRFPMVGFEEILSEYPGRWAAQHQNKMLVRGYGSYGSYGGEPNNNTGDRESVNLFGGNYSTETGK